MDFGLSWWGHVRYLQKTLLLAVCKVRTETRDLLGRDVTIYVSLHVVWQTFAKATAVINGGVPSLRKPQRWHNWRKHREKILSVCNGVCSTRCVGKHTGSFDWELHMRERLQKATTWENYMKSLPVHHSGTTQTKSVATGADGAWVGWWMWFTPILHLSQDPFFPAMGRARGKWFCRRNLSEVFLVERDDGFEDFFMCNGDS